MANRSSIINPTPSARVIIEQLFLRSLGQVVTRGDIIDALRTQLPGRDIENWHQRLSELRTDLGYTIYAKKDKPSLGIGEYVMPHGRRRSSGGRRLRPNRPTWRKVLSNASHRCQWSADGFPCQLQDGSPDHHRGGIVRLTPDHRLPHAIEPTIDPNNADAWQALCGRHQIMKRHYWSEDDGSLNYCGIVQFASRKNKIAMLKTLVDYFSDSSLMLPSSEDIDAKLGRIRTSKRRAGR